MYYEKTVLDKEFTGTITIMQTVTSQYNKKSHFLNRHPKYIR